MCVCVANLCNCCYSLVEGIYDDLEEWKDFFSGGFFPIRLSIYFFYLFILRQVSNIFPC